MGRPGTDRISAQNFSIGQVDLHHGGIASARHEQMGSIGCDQRVVRCAADLDGLVPPQAVFGPGNGQGSGGATGNADNAVFRDQGQLRQAGRWPTILYFKIICAYRDDPIGPGIGHENRLAARINC